MNKEELENTIKELNKVIASLGDINMNCDSKSRTLYQKKLNNSYDRLYSLKKHLEFFNKMEERKNEELKRKM